MIDYVACIFFAVLWFGSGGVVAAMAKDDGVKSKFRIIIFLFGFISLLAALFLSIFFVIKKVVFDD